MERLVSQRWVSRAADQAAEQDTCDYVAYVPDLLCGRHFTFSGTCASRIADAEIAVRGLRLVDATERAAGCHRLLVRAESIASSRIEGIEISGPRLLQAESAREFSSDIPIDYVAEEVLANIEAMNVAIEQAENEPEVTVESILRIHERVLRVTELSEFAGRLRTCPVWIGGKNPCSALYVPPPAEEVPRLMADLADFCNETSLPAIAQVAIAHAQFETIHPFVDGNGRTGRALAHALMRRRGVATRWCPPISLPLSALRNSYIQGLDAFHHHNPESGDAAADGVNGWIEFFADVCLKAVSRATEFDERLRELQQEWRIRLAPVRSGSAADLLLSQLAATPVVTVNDAARAISRSFPAANSAIQKLLEGDVLVQTTIGKRNRAFEAPEVLAAFAQLAQG